MQASEPAATRADPPDAPALRRVLRLLASDASGREVLEAIAEAACELTGASSTAVGLREGADSVLDFVAVAGRSREDVVGLQIRVDESVAEGALASGQAALAGGARGAAVAPVLRGGVAVGALIALPGDDGRAFDSADLDGLRSLGDCVALAMERDAARRLQAEQRRELDVLYDATAALSGSLNVQELLDASLDSVCRRLQHQSAALFLLNDDRTHLFVASGRNLSAEGRDIQLAADSALPSSVLGSGEPVLVGDCDGSPDLAPLVSAESARSAIVAPVSTRSGAIGLIVLASNQPQAFTVDDARLVTAVGAVAGASIHNAWSYEEAMRKAEEAAALFELTQRVNASLDAADTLEFVSQSVMNLLNVDGCAVMLSDRTDDRLTVRASHGLDAERLRRIRPRVGDGIAGWVCAWLTPTAVADVAADARNASAPLHQEGIASLLCVPVAVREDAVGVLLATSARRRLFTVAEMELLYTIANLAAASLVNADLYTEARARASQMRRYFMRVAPAIARKVEAAAMPQVMVDLSAGMLRADRCALYRVRDDVVHLECATGFRPSAPPDASMAVGQGLAGWVARRGKPLAVASVAGDPRAAAHRWLERDRVASYLGVPLKRRHRTVAVVEVFTVEPRAYADEEVRMLVQFARRAGVVDCLDDRPDGDAEPSGPLPAKV